MKDVIMPLHTYGADHVKIKRADLSALYACSKICQIKAGAIIIDVTSSLGKSVNIQSNTNFPIQDALSEHDARPQADLPEYDKNLEFQPNYAIDTDVDEFDFALDILDNFDSIGEVEPASIQGSDFSFPSQQKPSSNAVAISIAPPSGTHIPSASMSPRQPLLDNCKPPIYRVPKQQPMYWGQPSTTSQSQYFDTPSRPFGSSSQIMSAQ